MIFPPTFLTEERNVEKGRKKEDEGVKLKMHKTTLRSTQLSDAMMSEHRLSLSLSLFRAYFEHKLTKYMYTACVVLVFCSATNITLISLKHKLAMNKQ